MAQGPAEPIPARTSAPAWADLRSRLLSALVLAPAALVILWLGGLAWSALVTVAGLVIAWEWTHMCAATLRAPAALVVAAALAVAGGLAGAGAAGAALPALGAGFLLSLAIAARPAWRSKRPRALAAGAPYVGLALVGMIWLRADPDTGLGNVLFLVLVVWSSDAGAYAAGRLIGGARLAPRISPSKTWTGAAGGLLAATIVGYGIAMLLAGPERSAMIPGRSLLAAAVLAAVSQAGDLLESAAKRRFGVKDSSRLIPGHGGLLDRLDGILAAAPVAALLALALGPGRPIWS